MKPENRPPKTKRRQSIQPANIKFLLSVALKSQQRALTAAILLRSDLDRPLPGKLGRRCEASSGPCFTASSTTLLMLLRVRGTARLRGMKAKPSGVGAPTALLFVALGQRLRSILIV
jgi:hypothetical protein